MRELTVRESPEPAETVPGDPRVAEFVERLQTGEVDIAEECDLIWASAREGEHRFLFALACELETSEAMRNSPLGQIGAIGSLISEIEEAVVSIPGADCVETLFRFALLEPQNSLSHAPGRVDRQRLFASRIVLNQPRNAVLQVMAHHENDPRVEGLLDLLVHELVVQGYDQPNPMLERLNARMRANGHPLGWLPLHVMPLESLRADPRRTRAVHQYKVYGSKVQAPWGPYKSRGPVDAAEPRRGRRIRTFETTSGDNLLRLCSAVINWHAESKARIEGRVFVLSEPLAPDEVDRGLFLRLHNCEALELPRGPEAFHYERLEPAQALSILWLAAANGGELNQGCFGAYGRLRAWQSLGALAGASDFAHITEISALAEKTTWFFFNARSSWFFRLGEEFGLLALRPDGRSVALLAASDSD